jgi:hypothetical protein
MALSPVDLSQHSDAPGYPVGEMGDPGLPLDERHPASQTIPEMMAATIDDMIATRLAGMGLTPASLQAAVATIPDPEVRAALTEQLEAQAPGEDGRIPVTVRLQPFHHEYLTARAAANGQTPERMLETILREYRAADRFRPGINRKPVEQGEPARAVPR